MAVTTQTVVFEFDAQTGEVLKATGQLQKSMESVADAAQDAADSTEDIGKQAKKSGGLLKKAGKAGADAFKLVGAAIAATGLIGLVTKVLTPIIEAFLENKKVADTLRVAMAGIGAVIDTIIDLTGPLVDKLFAAFSDPKQAVIDLKNAIQENIETRIEGLLNLFPRLGDAIKAAFSGNFAEAGKIAADAMGQVVLGVENVTDKVADAVEAVIEFKDEFVATVTEQVQGAVALEKRMQALTDRQRELNVATAQGAAEVEELKRQSDDQRISIEQRIDAATRAAELNRKFADENVAIANETAALLRQELELQGETEERLQAVADAEIAAAAAAQASSTIQTELQNKLFALNQELIAQEEERLAAEAEARIAREEGLAEEQKLKDEAAAADAQRRKEELEAELATAEAIKQAKLDIAKSSLDALAALNQAFTGESEEQQKKGFERSKKIQTAQALISTYESAVQAFKSLAGIPVVGPGLGAAAAAAATAAGLANVKQIQSQQYQSASAGGGGAGYSSAGSAAAAVQQAPTAPTLDLGFLGEGSQQQVIETYVISENVTNAQQANKKIQDQATL
jgi:translation initiation factor 1 (eIF-1/SUI1)